MMTAQGAIRSRGEEMQAALQSALACPPLPVQFPTTPRELIHSYTEHTDWRLSAKRGRGIVEFSDGGRAARNLENYFEDPVSVLGDTPPFTSGEHAWRVTADVRMGVEVTEEGGGERKVPDDWGLLLGVVHPDVDVSEGVYDAPSFYGVATSESIAYYGGEAYRSSRLGKIPTRGSIDVYYDADAGILSIVPLSEETGRSKARLSFTLDEEVRQAGVVPYFQMCSHGVCLSVKTIHPSWVGIVGPLGAHCY